MGTPTYIGYAGTINRNGTNQEFNINNLNNDEITVIIEPDVNGDIELSLDDNNTLITILDANGVVIVPPQHLSLVEFGWTGVMNDGVSYMYTIITVDGVDYMFLDEVVDPTILAVNPFAAGNSNPLSSEPNTTGPHKVCFANGTRIRTPNGEVCVEDIVAGDLVDTRDHGVQRVVWVGARQMVGLLAIKHAPIKISKGAFGVGQPAADLWVSPQHRILVNDWRAELLFGQSEVLIAAKHLVNDQKIRVDTGLDSYSYHHILFENHETVFSEGLATESFHPGDMAMEALDQAARTEVLALFPELAQKYSTQKPLTHLPLKAYEARAMGNIAPKS